MASTTTARTTARASSRVRHAPRPAATRRPGSAATLTTLAVMLSCAFALVGPSPAAAATVTAHDGFGRTVASGLGTAESGGAWTLSRAVSDFSVSGGAAHLRVGRGVTRGAYLDAVAVTDVDAASTFSTTTAPTGGGVYETLVVRRRHGSDYGARLILSPSGRVTLALFRADTRLKAVRLPRLTATPGTKVRVRVQARGTNPTVLRARVWRVGTTQPGAWQLTASDQTTALQGPGSVGVRSYLSSTATAAPVVTDVDDLSATAIAPPTNQLPEAGWSTSSGGSGRTYVFDGSGSSDPDGPIVSWAWAFGDGTTGTGVHVSHTYPRPGRYDMTLTVQDTAGAKASATDDGLIAYATSAEWLADVTSAVVGAADYVHGRRSVVRPAIVLDIDNTAFEPYSTRPTAPVLAVAERAEQDGYEVLFATGRRADAGETMDQLRGAGYPANWYEDICFRDPRAASLAASKTACRAAWASQGYTIVANIGNQREDLIGANSGKTYLLPSYGYLD